MASQVGRLTLGSNGWIMVVVGVAIMLLGYTYIQQENYLSDNHHGKLTTGSDQLTALVGTSLPQTHEQWEQVYDAIAQAKDKKEFFRIVANKGLYHVREQLAEEAVEAPSEASEALGEAVEKPAEEEAAAQPAQDAVATGAMPRMGSNPKAVPRASRGHDKLPQLSKELAWEHSRDNVIIVTWTNFHFVDFALNWAEHLAGHGIDNYLVGSMDKSTTEELLRYNLNGFAMYEDDEEHSGLGVENFNWGGSSFHKMGRQKISLLKTFIDFGLDIMLCDSDTVWINDPTDYFNSLPQADILTSSDHLFSTLEVGDGELERPQQAAHSAMNIGVMFFRHGEHTVSLIHEWVQRIDADANLWDQAAFNQITRSDWMPMETHPENDRLFYGYGKRVVVGVLNVAAFASGHTFFVQRLHETRDVKPYVVHTTFQYGGTTGKKNRLRERMLWYDPPQYYDPPENAGFLAVELQLDPTPEGFQSLSGFDKMQFHLEQVEKQMLQLKAAFALAVTLDRILIMPKLMCHCDKYWGPVDNCRIPGAIHTTLPFVCPLDHLFEPFNFDDKPHQFGPPIMWREHSFLDNPALPTEVAASVVTLTVASAETGELVGPPSATPGATSALKPGMKAQEIVDTLRPVDEVRILRFADPAALWGGWDDGAQEGEFNKRINHLPSFWCCRSPDGPKGKGGTPYPPMIMGQGIVYAN